MHPLRATRSTSKFFHKFALCDSVLIWIRLRAMLIHALLRHSLSGAMELEAENADRARFRYSTEENERLALEL